MWLILHYLVHWGFIKTSLLCTALVWVIVGTICHRGDQAWFRTVEGRAYLAQMERYQQEFAQYEHDLAVWRQEQYRQQLQMEAMNDWIRMTGQREVAPTWEWVVNRMAEIERERAEAAYREQQLALQQTQVALQAAMVWEQERTRRALADLPQREIQAWDRWNQHRHLFQ